ncbi:MAG: hypothetical protein ACKVY0_22425 [Prosthecobacter sp.]|uniref:hypothetical protein n=1 Tax=Prosthecobacter sp. TaxID=1965333 RepID=UPI0038FE482B
MELFLVKTTPVRWLLLNAKVAQGYGRNFLASVAVQVPLLILGSLALDGGQLGQWIACSMAAYWLMALAIVIRRPRSPTHGDLIAVRFGFLFILMSFVTVTCIRWTFLRLW